MRGEDDELHDTIYNMNNKIIIASEIWPPDIGGPATFAFKLASFLRSQSVEAKVLTYADHKEITNDFVAIDRRCFILKRYVKYFWQLLKLSRSADLIFAQGAIASGIPAMFVKILTGKKLIIKIVGDVVWERESNAGKTNIGIDDFQKIKSPRLFVNRCLRNLPLHCAEQIIVPSEYLKKIVINWGINENKVKVIYNSFDLPKTDFSKAEAKERLHLSGKIVLSVGRLTKWKGFETLINLWPKVLQDFPDAKLVIVGSGPEEERLKIQNSKFKIKDSIIFAGQVKQEYMADYYLASDLFILNSGYEGLSHVILEALSYGLPAVVSNVGGNPELVQDRVNGRLFAYNNEAEILAIIREYLQLSAADLMAVKTRARKSVEQFSFEIMTKKYLELLTK